MFNNAVCNTVVQGALQNVSELEINFLPHTQEKLTTV